MATVLQEIRYANLGWQYYKHYYKDDPNKTTLENRNETILKRKWETADTTGFDLTGSKITPIKLKTTYPGLLIGSGYIHEAAFKEDTAKTEAFKIGFFFDHVTGMPYIPGSSVKGVLRAAFPLKDERKDKYRDEKIKYIRKYTNQNVDVDALRDCIFDGVMDKEQISIYKRDIFHDAYLSNANKGLFLGTDYITPHKNPLKNPNPIKFLKILPEVEVTFHFKLENNLITAKEKETLFRQILLDFGVGAKTNVGYGQFK